MFSHDVQNLVRVNPNGTKEIFTPILRNLVEHGQIYIENDSKNVFGVVKS